MSSTNSSAEAVALADSLGDVDVVAQLGSGSHATVYRVRRRGVDYALKVLHGLPSRDDDTLAAFCREAALLARVNHPGVPKVFEVGTAGRQPYLIQEVVEGQPLSERIEDEPLTEPVLVELAADVAAALAAAHRAGLVHRDVKPSNIIIAPSGRTRVIDFGLAAAGWQVTTDAVVGTLDYAAPEQSGMLNRPVDARADLYALGVVLFEAATGTVPFRADDVGELLAMHASTPAPDPRGLRPELSTGLAEVIGRLLAKDPDDRFQTAHELYEAVWRLVPDGTLPAQQVDPAAPALVGRDVELEQVVARWRRARSGGGGMTLISGPAGGGKSSLARAVADIARADGAVVLTGKCDADAALPLAPLRTAIEAHLRSVRRLPADAQAAAAKGLRAAAGAGASLLRSLSPTLAALLDAPELSTEDRHDQFADAVAAFLAALARQAGGLLVFIDDVQWLDPASRSVLRRLADDIGEVPLMLLTTARDDEAGAETVSALCDEAGAALDLQVPLAPLDEGATARLLGAYLAGSSVGPDLAAELSARGRGNPFTILEYLHALIDAGALRPSWGVWQLDVERLRAIELPTDVLDLVLARVDGLGAVSQQVLTVAAALGTTFDADLLGQVTGDSVGGNVTGALTEAADRGLLHRGADGYTFVHDRIREALLGALGGDDLRQLHQRIATVLDGQAGTDSPRVYATAHHYANGDTALAPERVYAACRAAGHRALEENAPAAAVDFLETAASAARAAGVELDSRFREALGVAYWWTGRLEPAREQLECGLAGESDPLRRAALRAHLANVLRSDWQLTAAIECAREGLAELGMPVPRHPVLFGVATAGTVLRWLVKGSPAPSDRPAQGEEAERLRLHALLCRAASSSAAVNLQHGLVVAYNVRGTPFAHRMGRTAEYLNHLAGIGAVAGSMRLRKRRDRIFSRATRIATEIGDPRAYADAVWFDLFSKLMSRDASIDDWAEVTETQRRWLGVDYYTNIVLMRCRDLVERGYAAEAMAWHDRGENRISEATADTFPGFAVLREMVAALRGQHSDVPAALSAHAVESAVPGHAIQYLLGAVQTAVELDELGEPFEAAIQALDRLGLSVAAIFPEYRMIYAYEAFARLTQLQRTTEDNRPECLARARTSLRRLQKAATPSGASATLQAVALLRGYHRVAQASLHQLQGEHDRALALLGRADDVLVRLDAPLVQYEAARVRARALRALGQPRPADHQAHLALLLANQHGWNRRARWVRTEFGTRIEPNRASHGYTRDNTGSADRYRLRLAALEQIGAAARVLEPNELSRAALDETLRILGAERAILFLSDGGGQLHPQLGRAAGADLTELTGYPVSLVDRVATERTPIVVTSSEEGAALGSRSTVVYGLRSIMIAPVELDGRLLGVVYLDSRVAKGVFTEGDVAILSAVTSHIAVSVETARAAQLERLARTDELTGVYNRRAFTDLAEHQLRIARHDHKPLVAIMIDIDNFKRVNDTYGHATGDEVIRAVAEALQAQVREPDVLGRYGGEEFALVMNRMHGDPMEVAERLRQTVAGLAVPGPAGPLTVTVSIGVAEFKPDDDLKDVLGRADEALYQAKAAGRNCARAG